MAIELEFERDDDKAATNVAKHGITFEEAVAIFADLAPQTIDTTWRRRGSLRASA